MKESLLTNYAFIDGQNVNLGIRGLGWKLDWKKLKVFLGERYRVKTAYIFIGYVEGNQGLYQSLQKDGYILIFKPTSKDQNGKIKGNVDADLVLQAMIDYRDYDRAIIVSGDGDYYSLIKYFYQNEKLAYVLSPSRASNSYLLVQAAKEKIRFLEDYRSKLEHIKK
jgi:uncharacterized LabA/DUF88 family protein